jgi:hypothetical protein
MNLSDLPAAQQEAFIASLQTPQAATTSSFQPLPDPFASPSPKADPFATPTPKAAAQAAAPQASMLPEPAEVANIATTISKTIGDVVTSVAAAARPRPAPAAPRPFVARPAPVVRPATKAQASAQDLAASLAASAEAKKAEEAKVASDRAWTYAAVGAGVAVFGAAVYALARK